MKMVLDTNVLVSGLLNPSGAPGHIVRMLFSGCLEIAYDARMIWEYEEVLKRPRFGISPDLVADIIAFVESFGHVTAGIPLKKRLPDPDDEPFLEVALAAKADFLITGNISHYPAASRQGIKVVSPADLMAIYRHPR